MTSRSHGLKIHLWSLVLIWTGAIGCFFWWDNTHVYERIQKMAISDAAAVYEEEHTVLSWLAANGGVIVHATPNAPVPPNGDHTVNRSDDTTGNAGLRLLNHSTAVLQMTDGYRTKNGTETHLTSLKYAKKETAPDKWEHKALHEFEKGAGEFIEFTDKTGTPVLRFMRPLLADKTCLECHNHLGYKAGDIRGGISVSVSMAPYIASAKKETMGHIVVFSLLWLLGIGGIFTVTRSLAKEMVNRDRLEEQLRISRDQYNALVENSLTGIYISQNYRIKFANKTHANIHGYPLGAIVGMNSLDLVHPEDRSMVANIAERRKQGKEIPKIYEVRCVTREGEIRWVQRRNTTIDYLGKPATLGNEIDVTDQRIAEANLKASEAQLRRLSERLLRLQETDRKHFAYEIQEEIGQSLAIIKLCIESAMDSAQASHQVQIIDSLQSISTIAQDTVSKIRNIAWELSPLSIEDLGIIPTISMLCNELTSSNPELIVKNAIHLEEKEIPNQTKIFIFRTLEDILARSGWISRFREIQIKLHRADQDIVLQVEILGQPRQQPADLLKVFKEDDMVLEVMRRRTETGGGKLRVHSNEKMAVVVEAMWPGTPT